MQTHAKTMKVAGVDEKGGPEAVHLSTVPVPKPGAHEVLIDIAAAGVGVWDPALVAGEFDDGQRRKPRVYGAEGAGVVVEVGAKVSDFKPGDRVYGFGFGNKKGGFFAEYAAIPVENVRKLPAPNLSLDEAGALAVSGLTALAGLLTLGLGEGDTLLLIGASGGVGHIALQLAKRMKLRVFAIASGDDGTALAKKLGADDAIDGKHAGVVTAARGFVGDDGTYDAALVFAGGDWEALLKLVDGVVAYPNGVEPAPKAAHVKTFNGMPEPQIFAQLDELIDGDFHVEVSRSYALGDTTQALRDVSEHHVGKLVIHPH
jgi:NADPH:quinone reductase-like Zn-dependent oxidoreductase